MYGRQQQQRHQNSTKIEESKAFRFYQKLFWLQVSFLAALPLNAQFIVLRSSKMSAAAHCNHHSLGLITFSKLDNKSVQTEQAHELEGRATTQEGCEKREKWSRLCICTGWGLLATEQLCRKDLGFPQVKGVRSVPRKPTLFWADNSNSAASKSREVTASLITVRLHLEYCVQLWDLRTRKPLTIWVTAGEKKKLLK